jgi:hypothetical protein
MFGKRRKEMEGLVKGLLDIVSISNGNVNTLQAALEHLGDMVESMNELILIQEARIDLLEKGGN